LSTVSWIRLQWLRF